MLNQISVRRRWLIVVAGLLLMWTVAGCSTTPRTGASTGGSGGGMGAKRAGGGSANEFTAQRLSRYIMPGMTLTEANDLMGWKANFKQGMFYWTAQRGLLVQTKRMGNDVLDEAMIFSVFDFYRRKMYTLSKDRTTITIASIPAELLKRR